MTHSHRPTGRRPLLPILLVLMVLGTLSVACGSEAPVEKGTVDGWTQYGAGVDSQDFTSLADVLADPQAHDGKGVQVEAEIDEVCQQKGCWMTLQGPDGPSNVRVTFADYAFFVPMDIAGRTVRVDGTFEVREVPVDEARHYLEDAGRDEEAAKITEPQLGYRIVATGVGVKAEG